MDKKTLIELAIKYGTDKWDSHYYAQHYDMHFTKFRELDINLLEIGVGGYSDPMAGGESLRMWKDYFSTANIHAIDIFEKSAQEEERIKIYQGSQIDREFLEKTVRDIGEVSLIVDDGSHDNKHIITTFKILFPLLMDGGIYVVEDLQTSYWPSGGDSFNLRCNKKSAINFFKSLVDGLNYEEFDNPYYEPNYFDKNIVSMQFYHNMVFIYKERNEEGSNLVNNNILLTRRSKHKVKAKLKYIVRNLISKLMGRNKRF